MSRLGRAVGFACAVTAASGCQFFFPTPIEKTAPTQTTPPKVIQSVGVSFRPGEVWQADVFLDSIRAGTGELRVRPACDLQGKPTVLVELSGASTGLARMLKAADTKSEAYLDLASGLPISMKSVSDIGDEHTEFATVYSPSHYAYRQTRTVPGDHDPVTHVVARAENVPVDGVPHNADSLLGYIRNWKPEVGTTGYIFVVVGRYPWSIEMTFVGPETLTTARGEEKALRIDATGQKLVADAHGFQPSSLTPKRSFTMWISDDDRHTPLRVLLETEFAKVTVELTSYRIEAPPPPAPSSCQPIFDADAVTREAEAGNLKRAHAEHAASLNAGDAEDDDDKEEKDGLQKISRVPD